MPLNECLCPIRPNMTWDELMNEIIHPIMNCCDSRNAPAKGWICPTLDKELRRADKERQRNERYEERKREKKRAG